MLMSKKIYVFRIAVIEIYSSSGFENFYLFFCSMAKETRKRNTRIIDMSFFYYGDWFW